MAACFDYCRPTVRDRYDANWHRLHSNPFAVAESSAVADTGYKTCKAGAQWPTKTTPIVETEVSSSGLITNVPTKRKGNDMHMV
jgi:hypothetical protein